MKVHTIKNIVGLQAKISGYGARILSLDVPDNNLIPTPIGKRLHEKNEQLEFSKGYNHNWVIKQEGMMKT